MNYRVQSTHAETDGDGRTFAPGEVITDLDTDNDFNKERIEEGVFVSEKDDQAADGRSDEELSTADAGATDAAIKLADESGIDLTDVTGTGKDGRITADDVTAAVEAKNEKGD
jgi:pyruvate/2-oxoglutarate dehydrogenase complex dihydrolipoamide acyltransferase (E2) component